MTSPSNQISSLTTNIYLSDEYKNNKIYLTDLFKSIVLAVNTKESAIYENTELQTPQSWFNNNNITNRRPGYRTVIIFPALVAIGTTSIPHNLGNISRFTFTKILGTARNVVGTLHVVLPQGTPDDVMITIDANNVNIICATATYNNFSAQVILEYLKD